MHLVSLHRYPIKGCRGHTRASAEIDRLGIVGDRRFMLVDAGGRFLSQREVPRLATLVPTLEGELLHVEAPRQTALRHATDAAGPTREVSIWDDLVLATDQGDEAAAWFTAAVGAPCRLVHFGREARRPLDPRYAPRPDAETAFSDGYPLLGVLQESLDDLNQRLAEPVPMDRFRPNLVFAGAPAWSEDEWTTITLGDVTFDAVKPCARCQVPTTDQITGERHPTQEPLRTLATFRTVKGRGTIFGMNLVPRGAGVLSLES